MIKEGLKPLPRDSRDLKYERLGGVLPALPTESFVVGEPQEIKDQLETDFCAAFAGCYVSELQEGVELSPEWQFAKIKQLEGSIEEWGADLRTACKSFVKFGSLEAKDAPYNIKENERNFIANWNNWSTALDEKAEEHLKESYFSITKGGYQDLFDAIRGALYQNRKKKRAVLTGAMWRNIWTYGPNGIIPKYSSDETGFGHAFVFIGQKIIDNVLYLQALLSNGVSMGDNGYFYFPREVVNKECRFGNYMFVDMDPEQAKKQYWTLGQKWINFWKSYLKIFYEN